MEGGRLIGGRLIGVGLYFARSAKGLQRIINKLESFCEKADLKVNLDKAKVMIFYNMANL